MEDVNVKDIESLDGLDAKSLDENQSNILRDWTLKGRRYGVAISVLNEAPQDELSQAKSCKHYDEIVARYPNRISVSVKN